MALFGCRNDWNKLLEKLKNFQCALKFAKNQYHRIREERDEMQSELNLLRRPENEIINELQTELLNVNKQSEIDINHSKKIYNELQDKLKEIEDLKTLKNELNENMVQRENELNNEHMINIKNLKNEILSLKNLNEKLESDINTNIKHQSYSKIDQMNPCQLKDALKNTKKALHELQTKISSIERKKDLNEKTAAKYNKRCNDLDQKYKKLSRENNKIKTELMSTNKLNHRLTTKNDKLLKEIQKIQNEIINGKELQRKINLNNKTLEAMNKKYDKLCKEHNIQR